MFTTTLWRSRGLLFQVSGINETAYCGDSIGWNTYPTRMFPNAVLIGRQVNAVDLVLSDVSVKPLNLQPHFLQRLQRMQGHVSDLDF